MRKIIIATIFSLFLVCGLGVAQAANLDNAFSGNYLNSAAEKASFIKSGGESRTLEQTISLIITTALSILGVIFIILIFYAGFLWMAAGGNEKKIETSYSIMKESIIGLLIVIGAYAISYFVLSTFLSNNKLG